jgi:hypothetical protein
MIMPARGSISYLVFSIVTCAESIGRPTISETLLSPLFRRGSRSNHTPKLILWLGLKSSTPIARDGVIGRLIASSLAESVAALQADDGTRSA